MRLCSCSRFAFLLSVLVLRLAWPPAVADDTPMLCLDTGGHAGMVKKLLFTPDGRQLVSVGDDKVIRLWDVATGEPVRSFRGWVGPGTEGSIYDIALSPDGRVLASGGNATPYVKEHWGHLRLFDLRTGQILRLLKGHAGYVGSVRFSLDGGTLVTTCGDKSVRLFDPATGECRKMAALPTEVYAGPFSPDLRDFAYTAKDDTVRIRYGENYTNERVLQGQSKGAWSLAWSPDGASLAAGGAGAGIRVWDVSTGQLRRTLTGELMGVASLAFSPEGKQLAGSQDGFHVRLWSLTDGAVLRDFPRQQSWTGFIAFSPDGKLLASVDFSGVIQLCDVATGEVRWRIGGTGTQVMSVAWSPDGTRVAWGNTGTYSQDLSAPLKFTFSLTTAALGSEVAPDERWIRAITQLGGRELAHTGGGSPLRIREGGTEVAQVGRYDGGFTFAPTGEVVAAWGNEVRRYDSAGKYLRSFVGHGGSIYAVAVSSDGRYLASGGRDQTVKIWPLVPPQPATPRKLLTVQWNDWLQRNGFGRYLDDPQGMSKVYARFRSDSRLSQYAEYVNPNGPTYPLLSIFRATDGEWVAWTPDGYYACSPRGERMIGWHINRGFDRAADYYPAYQFRRKFYRPDMIARLLEAGCVSEALRLADSERVATAGATVVGGDVAQFTPPTVELLSPTDGSTVTQAEVTVRARIKDPNNRKVAAVTLLVNGRKPREKGTVLVLPQVDTGDWTQKATLNPGDNLISVLAVNDAGAESVPVSVKVTYKAPVSEIEKPALYLLAVGVSKYQRSEFSLRFSAKDAGDLAEFYRDQQGKLFRKVVSKVLTDRKASRSEVLESLDWLSKQVTQRDWALVFLSGHGVPDNLMNYHFLPADGDPEKLKATGVVWRDFRETLANLPAKVFLVLDTCHAAGATGERVRGSDAYTDLLRDAATDETGLITFASCMPREQSLEKEEWNNGAFTKALLEALRGQGDANKDRSVTIAEVDAYVAERVKELTEGRQHPTTARPSTIRSSLPMAVVR